ncbi:MAG TPA: hypothetical protein V6C72_02015, partial [Chroococcales cyanobacterium]
SMRNLDNQASPPTLTVVQGGKREQVALEVVTEVVKINTLHVVETEGTPICQDGVCSIQWKPRRPSAA